MAATRVQVWLNPRFIVAPAAGRARRAASQLPLFVRSVCGQHRYPGARKLL